MPAESCTIHFHESFCELLHWQVTRGAWRLDAHLRVPLRGDPDPERARELAAENGAALRAAIKQAGIKVREAVVLVPKQWVTLRFVTLPSTDKTELREMAVFEAGRHIPFHMERHVIDYHLLHSEGIEGSRVMLAALDGPPAMAVTSTLEQAGIHASAIEVSTAALANSLAHSGLWDPQAHPTVVQLDLQPETTEITIYNDGLPIYSRSASVGTEKLFQSAQVEAPQPEDDQPALPHDLEALAALDLLTPGQAPAIDLANPEAQQPTAAQVDPQATQLWINRLTQEIKQTYDFARRQFDIAPLTELYLSGPGLVIGGMSRLLEERVPGAAVRLLDPFQDQREDAARIEADDKKIGWTAAGHAPLCCAAGALLRDIDRGAMRLNLLPPSYLGRHRRSRQRRALATTAGLALALVALLVLAAYQSLALRRAELDNLQQTIARNKERVDEIRYRQTVVRILEENRSEKSSALAILNTISGWDDLFSGDPMRVSITNFSHEGGEYVKIVGHAIDHRTLNEFVARLADSEHFAEVRIQSRPPYRFPHSDRQVLRYTINCYFSEESARKGRR